ncbi:cytochrome P450 [Mycena rebaudengoi]|nr:cytochrome P450 [Mycena rebaudengoi]
MLSPIAQISLISCGAYGVWSILRRVLAASPLDNIPSPPPKSFFTGNLLDFRNPDGWEFHKSVEEDYADVMKIRGQSGTKSLFVSDPAALYSIIIKDADIFEEGAIIHKTLFGHGILSGLHEERWMHRKMLIPAFYTPNLRRMTPLFYEIAERLRDSLSSRLGKGPQKLDMYPITSQTSLQFIGRTGVDADFDFLFSDPSAVTEYARVVKDVLARKKKATEESAEVEDTTIDF